jgi:hypothetical protein
LSPSENNSKVKNRKKIKGPVRKPHLEDKILKKINQKPPLMNAIILL